ncbi:hypothetical protein RFI_11421 [Reticulomyxa filosa]|uniref:Vacuolar protein sorting-associated protein 26C n=1 Tax=Reticulomyxa filosa TaxID=46433 RepID=X6NK32_RETFI|nr:hypothetical protein RFI_11421 [Reticulomyxa filosa]|eukprot:ETO25717.1 hypothetical protein RFI_11421 [Reticulomyxa filosa]
MVDVNIRLDHYDRCYYPNDTVSGVVVVSSDSRASHNGIKLSVEGVVNLRLSPRSVGLFEAFYSSLKPMEVMSYNIEVAPSGKLPKGDTELPFEFELKPKKNMKLHETYHGVYIDVQYVITVEMVRGFPNKNIKKSIEFICKSKGKKQNEEKVSFSMTPETLKNVVKQVNTIFFTFFVYLFVCTIFLLQDAFRKLQLGIFIYVHVNIKKKSSKKPLNFSISGYFDSGVCNVEEPFTGEIVVEEADQEIKSIELQFVRVETCIYGETDIREATEVQNIQLADGNVCHKLAIPIYMIFPRLFTCVTTVTKQFKVLFLFHSCNKYQRRKPVALFLCLNRSSLKLML